MKTCLINFNSQLGLFSTFCMARNRPIWSWVLAPNAGRAKIKITSGVNLSLAIFAFKPFRRSFLQKLEAKIWMSGTSKIDGFHSLKIVQEIDPWGEDEPISGLWDLDVKPLDISLYTGRSYLL